MKSPAAEGTAALDKALDVLDAVGSTPEGMAQTQLAERLGLPRTTLYRLLATLVARGLLRRDARRRVYRLGFRCFELARQAHDSPDLVAAASPELRALRDLTGETSYLAVLDGLEVLSLERFDGAHSQRSQSALGQRKPLHCTSQGKAILAALPAAQRDALVREISLTALTPRTLTDRRRLQAELKVIAARGWSVDDEEIVPDVRCVGAPIVDAQGQVQGAISVAGPAWRMTHARVEALGPEVADAARRIGAQLGNSSSRTPDAHTRVVGEQWAFLGQFAHWEAQTQQLVWADALAPALRRFDGRHDGVWHELERPVICLAPCEGGWLVGDDQGFSLLGDQGALRSRHDWPDAGHRPLALCHNPQGPLWASLQQADGRCAVVSLQAPWRAWGAPVALHDEPLQALTWDSVHSRLWAACSDSGSIWSLQTGARHWRRLVTVPKASGRVSALAVDAEGGVWVALQEGWSVMRFAPDGHLDRVVGLPVSSPTSLCLADPQQQTLYITTARHGVPIDGLTHAPLSGRLFRVDLRD